MHWVSLRFIVGYWFIVRFLHVLPPHPLMEKNQLYVLSFFSGVWTSAKKKPVQEGRGLTSTLLVPGKPPGLQDERKDSILQFLGHQRIRKVAHFESVRMFIACMEKNLNIDSGWWWWVGYKPTLPWACAAYWGVLPFRGFWRKNAVPLSQHHIHSPGEPLQKAGAQARVWKEKKLKHGALLGMHSPIRAAHHVDLCCASVWDY